MDAIRYFEIKKRMTKTCEASSCNTCPLSVQDNETGRFCVDFEMLDPEKAVEIVEKWGREHPVKTRQSELLKMLPNAHIGEDGVLSVSPCLVDSSIKCVKLRSDGTYECSPSACEECSRNFWLAEIGDEE